MNQFTTFSNVEEGLNYHISQFKKNRGISIQRQVIKVSNFYFEHKL